MNVISSKNKGFTLIETIIYIFLFAIIIGGGMTATYNIIESTNASHNHVILQEEANFIFRKIDWTISGAEDIDYIDPLGANTLTVSKILPGDTIATDFTFTESGNNLMLQRIDPGLASPGPEIESNSDSIKVSNLMFYPGGGGGSPESITIEFDLETLQNGRPATQTFSYVKYLKTNTGF